MLAFFLAALKSLPLILDLISQFKRAADDKVQRGLGYDQAVAETAREYQAKISAAHDIEVAAAKEHATKPDDTAFDNTFRRD